MLKIFLCKQENPKKKSFLTPFFLLLEVKKSVKPGQAVHRPEVIDKSDKQKNVLKIRKTIQIQKDGQIGKNKKVCIVTQINIF